MLNNTHHNNNNNNKIVPNKTNNYTQRRYSGNNNNQSKIPIYNGNKGYYNENLFRLHQVKLFNHTISDLKIMDLPEHVRINQNLHNQLNHCSHRKSQSLPSTPGSFTPKRTDECSISSNKNITRKKRNIYEEYLPLCEMQKGLQKGEIVEGILRINHRNHNDAYISAPDGGLDIFIKGLCNRNKALNGDVVAVKLNQENQWMISYTSIDLNWNEWKEDFLKLTKSVTTIHLEKLNLNSKESTLINQSLISSKNFDTSNGELLLKNEFPNLPIELFALSVSKLKKKIIYWPKFIQRTGTVVNIIEENHPRIFAGTIKFNNDDKNQQNYVLLTSCDQRNPQAIIPYDCIPETILNDRGKYKNYLFLAQITEWKLDSLYPHAKIVKTFGKCGHIDAETEMMLVTLNINTMDFPEEALNEYRDLFLKGSTIYEKELANRKDFRNQCVFTIDPETAKDLDDAISCRKLSNGRFEIGVHIADVSYFIREGSMLDKIAKDRATTVYLINKAIPMLPHIFCQDLCSLNPGQDKLTFSVVFNIDTEGKIFNRWFGRTIINSCCKLNYEQAQKFIESKDDSNLDTSSFPQCFGEWSLSEIGDRIKVLDQIAKKLRKKRFESGSLCLDKKKLCFHMDENGLPMALTNYEARDSNRLIEELMLLANTAVAELVFEKFAKEGRAFLRGHPRIISQNIHEFLKLLKTVSPIEFQTDSSLSISKSLQKLENEWKIHAIAKMFLIKAMKLAVYVCVSETDSPEKYHHYALNFKKYTHFTSPIRRYADIIVHRLLSETLGYQTICNETAKDLKEIAENCCKKKYNAFLASEKHTEIYLKAFISKIGPVVCKALVFQVFDHSFDILIVKFDIIQRVYLNQLAIENAEYKKDKNFTELRLKWKLSDGQTEVEQIIKSFEELDVEISITEKFDFKIIIANPRGEFIHK